MKRNVQVIIFLLLLAVCPSFSPVCAVLWQPTMPVYPYEPTVCDTIRVGVIGPVGCCNRVVSHVDGKTVTIEFSNASSCPAIFDNLLVVADIGKLSAGVYEVRVLLFGGPMMHDAMPYQRTFEVRNADCELSESATILPNFGSLPLPGIILTENVTFEGIDGSYWGVFQWNPKKASLELIAVGEGPYSP